MNRDLEETDKDKKSRKEYKEDIESLNSALEELDDEEMANYNSNWTLRKCCSKLLDKLSNVFSETVIEVLKGYLENDIQNKDWIIKERSILTLGAVGQGSYEFIKPDLQNLIKYLINELSNSNKLVRAISCWTLSRFSNFIINDNTSENKDEIFNSYLSELLKRFCDKEPIVQEAANTALILLINTDKDQLKPYFCNILKICTNVLSLYNGNSLLTLYETISMLSENFPKEFQDLEKVNELLFIIIKEWQLIYNMSTLSNSSTCLAFLDLIYYIIKVSGSLMSNYVDDFLNGSLILIQNNSTEKELISKALDLMSITFQTLPDIVKDHPSRFKVVETVYNLLNLYINDTYLKQYVLPLIGDICKVDTQLLQNNIDNIINFLLDQLEYGDIKTLNIDTISVCNNSCWTLGLIVLAYKDKIEIYIDTIIRKIMNIISVPKLNKSLAQNTAICLGRIGLVFPQHLSKYICNFIKQFCLSLKFVKDSEDKQQAFR